MDFLKKYCAMELVSERCIVSLLDRVVEVKQKTQTYKVWKLHET